MLYNFCTIVTADYLHYARALAECLYALDHRVKLHVLVTDSVEKRACEGNVNYLSLNDLKPQKYILPLTGKYKKGIEDELRWSLKPVLLIHLLRSGLSRVIYIDSDIHFYSSFSFLFDLLDRKAVLLSPHNRSLIPTKDPVNFEKNFTEGIFNGGFIGASTKGLSALEWWAEACIYKCEKDTSRGYYDDQKYLDLLPARFQGVYPIKHLGCNVAGWNLTDCNRIEKGGEVYINDVYPIVFIHFVSGTCEQILFGDDSLLKPYLYKYAEILRKYKDNDDLLLNIENKYIENLKALEPWFLKLRRRISRFKKKFLLN